MADITAYRAEYALSEWEQSGRLPTGEELAQALENSASSLWWQPDNPEYLDLRAQLYIYQALLHWQQPAFLTATAESLRLYRESVQLRPRWPYTWARMALVKAYRLETDAEFSLALNNAVTYGPWEPGVHTTLTEAGLYAWDKLGLQHRRIVAENIHRGLRYERKMIVATAKRYNKTEQVCAYLPLDMHSKRFCGW